MEKAQYMYIYKKLQLLEHDLTPENGASENSCSQKRLVLKRIPSYGTSR